MTDKLKKIILTIAALASLALGGAALAGATSGGSDNKAVQERSEPNEAAEQDDTGDRNETGDQQDKGDATLNGDIAARARAAAVAALGGGKAGSVESETEQGATYGVEVVKPDGAQVDVFLDEHLKLIAVDSDG